LARSFHYLHCGCIRIDCSVGADRTATGHRTWRGQMRPAARLRLSVWRSCRNPWELPRKLRVTVAQRRQTRGSHAPERPQSLSDANYSNVFKMARGFPLWAGCGCLTAESKRASNEKRVDRRASPDGSRIPAVVGRRSYGKGQCRNLDCPADRSGRRSGCARRS